MSNIFQLDLISSDKILKQVEDASSKNIVR